MLRNSIITGLVAAVMGGFVLAYQAAVPESKQQPQMAQQPAEDTANGQMPQAQPPASGYPVPTNGDEVAQPMPPQQQAQPQPMQPGPMMGQAQPPGMKTMQGQQQMPMMGMCGRMMSMMMGGGMNQRGSMSQSGAASQSATDQAALRQELNQLRQEVERLKNENSQ